MPAALAAARNNPCSAAKTQRELNACYAKVARASEAKLQSTIEKLRSKFNADQTGNFEAAQSKWQDYRDAYCGAVSNLFRGGSMAAMQEASCRSLLTDHRAAELQALLTDLAGLVDK